MRIAFHTPQLDVRGTCVAIYDYAHYNETLLNNRSIIILPELSNNDEMIMNKFYNRFQIITYGKNRSLEDAIEGCDVLYCIKYGKKDRIISTKIKTVVHCVFDMTEPHGDVYAGVSSTLARKFNNSVFVPHMVGLKPDIGGDNMRKELGIPKNAVVFGRHGGQDTFNLDFAINGIQEILDATNNIWFVFVNTPKYWDNKRVIYINKIIYNSEKNRFINTCDAHLECGTMGHTFGLSMAEFSVNNKPIISHKGNTWNTAHLDILGDKAIYFDTKTNFIEALTTFVPKVWEKRDNNCYRNYTPENVMGQFNSIFLI